VNQALKDVEVALVRYDQERIRRSAFSDAVEASRQSLILAQQAYGQGLTDLTTVLDAQRSVFSADDSLARSEAALRTDVVALYKALGGGWKWSNPEQQTADRPKGAAAGDLPKL
jgi:outer membrane protein TolC